jgi:internalin A
MGKRKSVKQVIAGALRRIAGAPRNNATELDLSGRDLLDLSLSLSGRDLTALPEWLGQLTQLQSLDLSNNQLTALPEWLGQLTQLQSLDLWANQLTALPESLGQLTQLQSLSLSVNQLTALPEWLGQLTQLQSLHLSLNQLTALPESLGQLTQLQSLDLSDNQLTALPESLGQLTGLRALILSDNRLSKLPQSLRGCERLEGLFLHGNQALGIPTEVLGPEYEETRRHPVEKADPADPQTILSWYFQSRAEPTRRLNEAKMLLVGQGGVGKTSLVHYLIHQRACNPDELPTEGINIDDWEVSGKPGGDGKCERIQIHVWDFGGQEIMHATHQFFLTRRSLYLLVIDARAGEKESNIHYWLKIIRSYGDESPVLVVINKCDQHPHELNETRLKRDYSNIRGFLQTSCADGRGIAALRREIGKQIRRLPQVFDELPQSYFEVKAELEQTASERSFLPIDDYRGICNNHGVDKRANQDHLIRFLHDLGVVLNFQDPDDPYGQNDPYVLDPEWVTGGVYALINDRELKERLDGLLSYRKLTAVLNAQPGYPQNRHDFIVRKMQQFELAYPLDQGHQTSWLVPELLDPKEPESLDWQPERSLNFQYSYPVLPPGVICRLIVRMHQHVDRECSWRSGTVLKFDQTRVLVRGDFENHKVFIAVQGPRERRKEDLAVVRNAFRHVHSTIPALQPKEEVPLPDHPDLTVPYEHLLMLEQLHEPSLVPVGAHRRYSVTDLLNGVDSTGYRNERQALRRHPTMTMNDKHVFVSYCHDNKADVARLVADLEAAGERVWWDEQILGGQDWKQAIRAALKDAYAVILCLSPELTEDRYRSGVYPELRDAIATLRQCGPNHAYIFPVRLAACAVPPIEIDDTRTLERIQHVDLFPQDQRDAGLQKLLKSLDAAPGHP